MTKCYLYVKSYVDYIENKCIHQCTVTEMCQLPFAVAFCNLLQMLSPLLQLKNLRRLYFYH